MEISLLSAGKAIFTIFNDKKEHFTYKIQKHKTRDVWFTSVKNGHYYSYMGLYNPNQHTIFPTKNGKIPQTNKSWNVLLWGIKTLKNNQDFPTGYGIKHEGKCFKCGRKLTTPESIKKGVGPECIKYL